MSQGSSSAYLIFTVAVGIVLLFLAFFACRGLYISLVVYQYTAAVSSWDWILGIFPLLSLLLLWAGYRWQSRIGSPIIWWLLASILVLNLSLPLLAGGIFWGSNGGALFG